MKSALLKFAVVAAVGVMMNGMATADTISGTDTFVGASEANTNPQSGPGAFSSPLNLAGLWFSLSDLTLNVTGSGGFEANPTDVDIVTGISGLPDGTYEVGIVYGSGLGTIPDFGFSAGFGAAAASQVQLGNVAGDALAAPFEYPFYFVTPYKTTLGTVEVIGGSDITVFIQTGVNSSTGRNTYNGLTYELVAVPEPSSMLALLGLGGLVMSRRRR